jgi:hypothetical protein
VTPSRWHWPSVLSAVAFSAISAVHLIDEFQWGAPFEFHLTVQVTEILALAYLIAVIGLTVAASHQSPTGYLGLAIAGSLIAVADLSRHGMEMLAEGPWRSGLPSELLAVGLTVSALLTAVTSFLAWRAGVVQPETPTPGTYRPPPRA